MTNHDADVLKLLTDHQSPESWMNRQLGAQLAAQRGLVKAERLLALLLDDDVEWVRYHAFSALVELGVPASRLLPVARRLTRDSFFRTRQAAHDYVREIANDPMLTRQAGSHEAGSPSQPEPSDREITGDGPHIAESTADR